MTTTIDYTKKCPFDRFNSRRTNTVPVGERLSQEDAEKLLKYFKQYYSRNWMNEYATLHEIDSKPEERIYSDIDPYGEENWNQ